MRDGKWRMTIESESWEFDNQADMLNELNNLLTLKNTHGLKNNNTYTNAR